MVPETRLSYEWDEGASSGRLRRGVSRERTTADWSARRAARRVSIRTRRGMSALPGNASSARTRRPPNMKHALLTAAVAVCWCAALLASPGQAAVSGFSTPLQLPGSFGFGEPSLAMGSGRIVATAPNGLLTTGTSDQPSPVWVSTNGGASFNGPITPTDAGLVNEPLGGGDTDVIMDAAGDIFQTDLWLGDTTMRV